MSSPQIVNIAGYKFVALDNLRQRRLDLRDLTERLQLKGTILLSSEGINLFLAGTRDAIDHFLNEFRTEPEFAGFTVKESLSDRQPFTRMLVRLKQEIIAFGVKGIDPARSTARRISPRRLKEWLDAGKQVTLLDTRNDYEIELGTFRQALPAGIQDFRQFPKAVARLPEQLKHQPIVTFCTGGIRCEKAAPYMEHAGFTEVYQLDGGILKYFEDVGGAHYRGDCFVFDQRVALTHSLEESSAQQCYACQATLTPEDCRSPLYLPGRYCPKCYRTPEERMAATLRQRHAALIRHTTPLPGSVPYENRRPIRIAASQDGQSVLEILEHIRVDPGRLDWQAVCLAGRVHLNGVPVAPNRIVRQGDHMELVTPGLIEPDVNAQIEVLFEDDALVAIHKPAPLPVHPAGRFNRNTLYHILLLTYHPWKLRAAHRLDANTSGLLLLTKARRHAAKVQTQFEAATVRKRYLARVVGHPTEDRFTSTAPISKSPASAGGRVVDPQGLPALTEFHVLHRFPDRTALVEATPKTGRTNQIRIHLWHLGTPVCGDPLYLPARALGHRQTLLPTDPPLCLHSSELHLRHPLTNEEIHLNAPDPSWTLP